MKNAWQDWTCDHDLSSHIMMVKTPDKKAQRSVYLVRDYVDEFAKENKARTEQRAQEADASDQ